MLIPWMTVLMTFVTLVQMFQTGLFGANLFSLGGFLEVRRKVKRAWRIRNENLSRTLDWGKMMKSRGYQLVKAACKQVQRD